ncbi:barstar family protein [Lentzea sp. NPDC051213]|uniref:barstar family protein n=1 Tax=Lentzea sp. NPDC051213 TaxID=3364126 RepID=UPI0037B96300
MKRHILVSEKKAAIAAIAEALSFPEWFGHNLDALYDSLTDLSWLDPGEYVLFVPANLDASVSEVLRDAAKQTAESGDRRLRVVRTDR